MPNSEPVVKVAQASHAAFHNAASALVYRWWGLFERPDGTDVSTFLEDMFTDDIHIQLRNVDITGLAGVKAGLAALPDGGWRAHHIKSIKVTNLGSGDFRLDAAFIYQTREPGLPLRSGEGTYAHTLKTGSDGKLRFSDITALLGNEVPMAEFKATYVENRAKAVIIQFQAVLDALTGEAEGLRELIKPDAEFNGLVAPPSGGSVDLNKWDLGFKGFDELSKWASSGPSVFCSVSHELETFSVKSLGGNRYEAVAQFKWVAETLAGKVMEKHTPRTWILVDEGEKFMRIQTLV